MPHFDVSDDRSPWVRDPDAGMGYETQNRGLSISGPGSHNVSRSGSASFVSVPRDKRPSDEQVDRLIDMMSMEIGAAPLDSKREILRRLVRDWHANH